VITGPNTPSARHNVYFGLCLDWPIGLIPLGPTFLNEKLSHVEHFVVDGCEKINADSLKISNS